MLPTTNTRFPVNAFTINGIDLAITLLDYDPVSWPDIVVPILYRKITATTWENIAERQPIWNDQKVDFEAGFMAKLITDAFNLIFPTLVAGTPVTLTYNEQLSAELQKYIVQGNQLIKLLG